MYHMLLQQYAAGYVLMPNDAADVYVWWLCSRLTGDRYAHRAQRKRESVDYMITLLRITRITRHKRTASIAQHYATELTHAPFTQTDRARWGIH